MTRIAHADRRERLPGRGCRHADPLRTFFRRVAADRKALPPEPERGSVAWLAARLTQLDDELVALSVASDAHRMRIDLDEPQLRFRAACVGADAARRDRVGPAVLRQPFDLPLAFAGLARAAARNTFTRQHVP